jgi:hypothetical protein
MTRTRVLQNSKKGEKIYGFGKNTEWSDWKFFLLSNTVSVYISNDEVGVVCGMDERVRERKKYV